MERLLIFRFMLLLTLGIGALKVTGQCYEQRLRPTKRDGKYGAINLKTGKLAFKPKFIAADSFPGPYLLVAKAFDPAQILGHGRATLWPPSTKTEILGLADVKGKLVLPMEYQWIYAPDCRHFMVNKGGKTQLLDQQFQVIYEDTSKFHPNLALDHVVYEQKLDKHLSNFRIKEIATGKLIFQVEGADLRPLYKNIDPEDPGERRYLPFYRFTSNPRFENPTDKREKSTSYILDRNGKTLIDSVEECIIYGDLIQLTRKGLQIFTDANLQVYPAISNKYTRIWPVGSTAKWFNVKVNQKEGILDSKGNVVIPFTGQGGYRYIGNNGFLFVNHQNRSERSIHYTNGRKLDLTNYDYIEESDTTIHYRPLVFEDPKNQKYGLTDSYGNLITPAIYDQLYFNSCRNFFFRKGKEIGFLNLKGQEQISGSFLRLSALQEGLARAIVKTSDSLARDPENVTFIDSTGRFFGGGFYQEASAFKDGVARVKQNEKYFMIDKQGKPVTFGKYQLFSHYAGNVAIIANSTQTKYGLVHKNGKVLVKPTFTEISLQYLESDLCNRHYISFDASHGNYQFLPVTMPKLKNGTVEANVRVKQLDEF